MIISTELIECVAYSTKYNLEFYCIPKNALTTAMNYLEISNIQRSCINKNPNVFCIIRNPITRLMSSFAFLQKLFNNNQTICSHTKKLEESKYILFYQQNKIEDGFQNYIDELVINGPFDLHNICQTDFLSMNLQNNYPYPYNAMIRDRSKISYYLDFDNLEHEISEMIHDENFKMPIRYNSTTPETIDILTPIAQKNYDNIRSVYNADFLIYESIKNELQ